MSSGDYEFTVDWEDGTSDVITTYNQAETTHTYATSGEKSLSITGTIKGFQFDNGGDKLELIDVSSWGPLQLSNTGNHFWGGGESGHLRDGRPGSDEHERPVQHISECDIPDHPDLSAWDLSGVTHTNGMFRGATSLNADVSVWNVSAVQFMSSLFRDAPAFDQDLGGWDIMNVTDMSSTFRDAAKYSSRYDWSATSDAGSATISGSGLVRVTGLEDGQSATVTVRTTRDGYGIGVGQLTRKALDAALTPKFAAISPNDSGFTVAIQNDSSQYDWAASSTSGTARINSRGQVTVSGLKPASGTVVTVTATRNGYRSGAANLRGNAGSPVTSSAAKPTKPTLKKVKARKGGRAKIKWASRGDGGAPILKAVAVCKAKGSKRKASGVGKGLNISGLRKGKTYKCTVRVKNQVGWSPKSKARKVRAR